MTDTIGAAAKAQSVGYAMKTKIIGLIAVVVLALSGCGEAQFQPPETATIRNPTQFPHLAPDDWLLAHVDVETTGLIPGFHEMIDIGLVYTTVDGELLDSVFLRIQPQHPERLSPGAFAVNAFDPERWRALGAVSPSTAVDSLVSFHQRVTMDKSALMVAYNSHFDAAFLDHLFRSQSRTWRELFHYFILDIPSMAWGLGFRDLTAAEIMEKYDVDDELHIADQHTGITGAMKNVRVYRALLRHRAAM